jgi:hypothetical protein
MEGTDNTLTLWEGSLLQPFATTSTYTANIGYLTIDSYKALSAVSVDVTAYTVLCLNVEK